MSWEPVNKALSWRVILLVLLGMAAVGILLPSKPGPSPRHTGCLLAGVFTILMLVYALIRITLALLRDRHE